MVSFKSKPYERLQRKGGLEDIELTKRNFEEKDKYLYYIYIIFILSNIYIRDQKPFVLFALFFTPLTLYVGFETGQLARTRTILFNFKDLMLFLRGQKQFLVDQAKVLQGNLVSSKIVTMLKGKERNEIK